MALVFQNLQIENNFTGARSIVRVATTANGALATAYENGDTIDGVTLATGDRILIKDQTTQTENGIYVVEATGAPTRATDMTTNDSANSMFTWVQEGTTNANTAWICDSAPGSDVVGTDNLTFAQFDVASTLTVARGGTGATTFTSGNVLVGAGTSAITATQAAPSGAFVGTTDSQTLTNKTIDADNNTITNIEDADIKAGAAIAATKIADGSVDNTEFQRLGAVTSAIVGISDTQTLTNKTLTVDSTTFQDNADNTKTLAIDLSGSATSTALTFASAITASRTITFPDETGTLATQTYADSVAQGLDVKDSVVAASEVDLDSNSSISGVATYNNTGGSSGRGQITATLAVSDTFTVDGVNFGSADDGSRILLKAQTNADENGIWTTTVSGTSLTLDRAVDFDEDSEVTAGAFTFVEEGTVNADSGWVLTTNDPITIGGASGTNLTFVQFSGAGQITAGDGLDKSGNTLSVDLKADGGLVIESTEIAVDLGASNITGTLAVGDGGTGATTFTSGDILQGNGTGAITASGIQSSAVVTLTGTQTLTNKTLTSPVLTTPEINDTSADHQYVFAVSELAADRTVTLPLLTGNDTFVFEAHSQTLTNKTLTSPIINQILDSNSNELLIFTTTASAVNEITLANAATGTNPEFSATGDDANVGIDFQAKGTGTYRFLSTASGPSTLVLFEDTDLGSNSVSIDVPDVTASYTLTLPPAAGTTAQVLRAADNSGNLEFATVSTSDTVSYVLQSNQVSVSSTTATPVAYFAWDNSQYSSYNAGTVIFWHEDVDDRNLTVALHDGTSDVGTTTINSPQADGIATFSITNPSSDVRLALRVSKSANGGTNPTIYGVQIEFTL